MMRSRLLSWKNRIRNLANKEFDLKLGGSATGAIGNFFKTGRLILGCSGRRSSSALARTRSLGARISVKYAECQ